VAGLLAHGIRAGGVRAHGIRTRLGRPHHEPPEIAWLPPELDIGLEPELKPLEPDELELEPDEPEFDVPEPDEVEPEPEDEFDEPEPAEVPDEPDDEEEELAVLCVDPGRARATAPATTTLAMVTAVVVERTLARPLSLAAMAWRIRSRCALLMVPSCGHVLEACCMNLLGQL
jgi:hypothetical protein